MKRNKTDHADKIVPVRMTGSKNNELESFCGKYNIDKSVFMRMAVSEAIAKYETLAYRLRSLLAGISEKDLIDVCSQSKININTVIKFKEGGGEEFLSLDEVKLLNACIDAIQK